MGRSRKLFDKTDKDRKAVQAAINRCLKTIKKDSELFTHFDSFINYNFNQYRYNPDREIYWLTE